MALTKIVSDQIQGSAVHQSNVQFQAIGSAQLTTTGVVAGTYTNATIVVDDRGRIYTAASGAAAVVFSDQEVPTGAVNGVNTVFTLVGDPNPQKSLHLFRNGLRLHSGATHDYQLTSVISGSPAFITFDGSAIPQTGDVVICDYRS